MHVIQGLLKMKLSYTLKSMFQVCFLTKVNFGFDLNTCLAQQKVQSRKPNRHSQIRQDKYLQNIDLKSSFKLILNEEMSQLSLAFKVL